MEFSFLFNIACSLVGSLLGNVLFGPGQAPPQDIQETKPPVIEVVEKRVSRDIQGLKVPGFVSSVPSGHFAGVSVPCGSLAEARKSAVDDAARQVLGCIGIEYNHKYINEVWGSPRSPERRVHDRLSGTAHGIVFGIERNIVESSWSRDISGKYVSFVLVRCPDEMINDMRRLSRGAKVTVSILSEGGDGVIFRVTEVNGVGVVLSSADVCVRKRNRFAKAISFFVWRVPSGSERNVEVAFGPVRVCGGASEICIPLEGCGLKLSDYILGASLERVAVLRGHDELGRDVSAVVRF